MKNENENYNEKATVDLCEENINLECSSWNLIISIDISIDIIIKPLTIDTVAKRKLLLTSVASNITYIYIFFMQLAFSFNVYSWHKFFGLTAV